MMQALSEAKLVNADSAARCWEELLAGQWLLVDRFDAGGWHFVVATKNVCLRRYPRRLSPRERQIAEHLGMGRSSKEIAYILGVTQSAVTNCIADAQLKLGLASSIELAAFFAPSGLQINLAEVTIAGEQLLVGTYPLVDEKLVKDLTEIEREIVNYLLTGLTNGGIALRRNTSVHTIANQLHTIYHKLGVRSRGELAAKLQGSKRPKV